MSVGTRIFFLYDKKKQEKNNIVKLSLEGSHLVDRCGKHPTIGTGTFLAVIP
jgi:hypothetical protein